MFNLLFQYHPKLKSPMQGKKTKANQNSVLEVINKTILKKESYDSTFTKDYPQSQFIN